MVARAVPEEEEEEGPAASSHLRGTIIVVLQGLEAEEISDSFDCIDQVQRENGQSTVLVDGAD